MSGKFQEDEVDEVSGNEKVLWKQQACSQGTGHNQTES